MFKINHLSNKINKVSVRLTFGCFLLGSISLLALSGCKKFLEMPVKDKVPQENLYSDEQGFMDGLTGVYLNMDKPSNGGRQGLYTNDMTIGMLSVMANNYTNAANSSLGDQLYSGVAKYDYASGVVRPEIDGIWGGMYNNIANLNNLLSQIDGKGNVFSRDNFQRVKGEALALRAMFHFDLARLFGQSPAIGLNEKAIPYITKFTVKSTPFVSLNAALDSCINDLNNAKSLLAKADTSSLVQGSYDMFNGYTQNHMNYWATKSLLARVYLYKGDYANAKSLAQEVIASGKFPLSTSNVALATSQTRDRLFSKELVFSLYNSNLISINKGLFDQTNGNLVANKAALYTTTTGSTSDYRFISWFDNNSTGTNVPSKYFQDAGLPYNMQNIIPIIRVTEMYLIVAECANKNGDLAGGLDYLNKVRKARGLISLTTTNVPDEPTLSNEIMKEYKKEFFQEGQTFFYYKRLNKDLKAETGAVTVVAAQPYVLPIPDKEAEYNK